MSGQDSSGASRDTPTTAGKLHSSRTPRRSRRIYVYWGAAFTLLLALGLFCWLVARPVLEVRRWLPDAQVPYPFAALDAIYVIDRLGGPERAAAKLSLYLRLAARSREEKELISRHLGFCGPSATPTLARALGDKNPGVRWRAAEALGETGDPRAVDPLIAALRDESDKVRRGAAWSLGWLADTRAIGPLEAIPADAPRVRETATYALKMIRARDLDYCLRLARSGNDRDNEVALMAIARFHVREGMSRGEVGKLLGDLAWPVSTDSHIRVIFAGRSFPPSADFWFEEGRLVSWDMSFGLRTRTRTWYSGEKYRR